MMADPCSHECWGVIDIDVPLDDAVCDATVEGDVVLALMGVDNKSDATLAGELCVCRKCKCVYFAIAEPGCPHHRSELYESALGAYKGHRKCLDCGTLYHPTEPSPECTHPNATRAEAPGPWADGMYECPDCPETWQGDKPGAGVEPPLDLALVDEQGEPR